ncbi:hypothetical protein MUY35_03955 [Aliiroseovarius sp. S1339]|uniref:hypothetical protein n=1 Tax=Aliiroseovarius sp. S1339 TaxID=2936990 RepID=UPI0020C03C93|nr:hypothetical protein [Aliiroseovarius sp. S1339]MCK8463001.1 hypothetical protein [Aliiroseovarius sp. S1339]
MSDPVSNAEIEDVLSSIRRLISESKATEGREASTKTEKLVLTPAFRVHDDSSPKPSGTVRRDDDQVAKPAAREAASQDAARGDAKPEAASKGADDHAVPVFSHRGYGAGPVEDAEELPSREQAARRDDPTLTGRVAEFEDAVNLKTDLWEPDGGEDTTQSDVLMFHAARLRTEDEDGIVGESEAGGWSESGDAPEAPFVAVKDPADAEPQPPVGTRQTQSATAPSRAPEAPAQDVEIVGDDTDIIDEEVVHAMVARLVREELQGEVGEKITQSIRRFVRREIERSLTLKGLE